MKDSEANVALIRHLNQWLDEFFDEYRAEDFQTIDEFEACFRSFLQAKYKTKGAA